MPRNNGKKSALLFLFAVAVVIVAGCIVLFTSGFAGAGVSGGGWIVSAGVTAEYQMDAAERDEILASAGALIPGSTAVQFEESQQLLNEVIAVYATGPVEIGAETFTAEMNRKYPGLLTEGQTYIVRLERSFAARDDAAVLFTALLILTVGIFLAGLSAVGLRASFFNLFGIFLNLLTAAALMLLVRVPFNHVFFGALAVCLAVSAAANILTLRAPAGGTVKQSFWVAALIMVLCALIFAAAGLASGADSGWYHYIIALLIAVLPPYLFSNIVISVLFAGKKQ